MRIIGITGGVGSGKSTVIKELNKVASCRILYADDAAHMVYLPGNDCYERLKELFGDSILDDNGLIDRKKMSAAAFGNDDLLEKVNSIVHPAVKEYILRQIDEAKKADDCELFLLEAALLIECGYNDIVDEMWYVYANPDVRRLRLKTSRGYSDEKIDAIMASQLSDEEYRRSSDFVIDNSNSVDECITQIIKRIRK